MTSVDAAIDPAAAIILYGMSSPNVFKLSIMLEEAELPYSVRHVDVVAQEQRQPAFLAISPNGRVPIIVDPQGPSGEVFSVFESGAALIYLAEKAGRLLPAEPAARSTTLQWLMFQVASIGPMFGQYVHFSRHAPPGQDYGARRYGAEVLRLCDVLERRLEGSEFLGGAAYSIADVASFPWIRAAMAMFPMFQPDAGSLLWTDRPALRRWFDVVRARPAVDRGVAAMAPLLPLDQAAFAAADPAALDRFFGRTSAATAPGLKGMAMVGLDSALDDRSAILEGLGRFARILDSRDWNAVGTVFADDVVFDYGDSGEKQGLHALIHQFRSFLDPCGASQHLIGSVIVELNGDSAVSRAYVQARHQGAGARAHLIFDAHGEYVDHWRRQDAGWRIVRRNAHWSMHIGDPSVLQAPS